VAERSRFFPSARPVKWTYPSPKCLPGSTLGVRPVRAERHNPWSIATLRQTIARFCSDNSPVSFLWSSLFYNTVVLVDRVVGMREGRASRHRSLNAARHRGHWRLCVALSLRANLPHFAARNYRSQSRHHHATVPGSGTVPACALKMKSTRPWDAIDLGEIHVEALPVKMPCAD